MAIQGIFNTTGLKTTTNLTALSFDKMITRLMPNGTAPLFALTSYLNSETAVAVEHGYFAKGALFPFCIVTVAATNVATSLTVDSTENLVEGMVLQVNNTVNENVLVESVISDTVIQVRRAFGGTAAAISGTTTPAFMVGNSYEEASVRPVALNITPKRITNLTQIFRNSWAISDTVRATLTIAGDTTMSESKQDCAALHAQAIEASLFFGKKYEGVRKGQPIRTMDGLISIVSDIANYPTSYSQPNVYAAAATTNYTQLEGFLDPSFNQTTDPKVANERVLFVGGKARTVINNIGRLNSTYFIENGETEFGLQFATFKTSRGTFRMIEHPLFNSNSVWNKMAVSVDLSSFKMAYLQGRKTQNKEFNNDGGTAQDFGIDAVGGTLTTECTALVKNPPANAIITGLTAAAQG
jgi:Family of unknown function (DUF5309)